MRLTLFLLATILIKMMPLIWMKLEERSRSRKASPPGKAAFMGTICREVAIVGRAVTALAGIIFATSGTAVIAGQIANVPADRCVMPSVPIT